MFCIKQILLFQTMDLRVDAREEFSRDKHGFEIQENDLNAQEIFNRDEKAKESHHSPNKMSCLKTSALGFLLNKEHLHNLGVKCKLVKITSIKRLLEINICC